MSGATAHLHEECAEGQSPFLACTSLCTQLYPIKLNEYWLNGWNSAYRCKDSSGFFLSFFFKRKSYNLKLTEAFSKDSHYLKTRQLWTESSK